MKKVLAVILTLVLFVSALPVIISAEETFYPTVVVPGYSASYLYAVEDGNKRQIWGSFEGLNIADVVLSHIVELGAGLGAAVFGKPQYFVDIVSEGLREILGDLAFNPDGTPVIDTVTYPNDPAVTNYTYLREEEGSAHAAELEIMSDIAEAYGENGYDYLFSFQTDFRLNVTDAVENLRNYIDDVLEYTGASKVNIYAVSYGGQISASYLSLYGHEGKVKNAVLTVPAIGGAALAYDVMSENVRLDEETLMYFIENGMMLEEDINWLMKAHSLGFLDKVINMLIKDGIKDILGYWGSIWDFIPVEYYDNMKDLYLDKNLNAELISKSDIFHYEILPAMGKRLRECKDYGTNVSIIAGTDAPAVTGLYEQSDGIILVNSATGAYCAPFGLRFSDGYDETGDSCSDPSHNHISPSMNIDASYCYIPEETWFISGLFHGMTWKDPYTVNLCTMLLFTDSHIDVHTYNEFPQFMYSTNNCHSVSASFNSSKNGFWNSDDTVLTVTNLSKEHKLMLISVDAFGVDCDFTVPSNVILSPGESVDIAYDAIIPEKSGLTADIIINYYLIGSITPHGERNLTFSITNGDKVPASTESIYTSQKHQTYFDEFVNNCLSDLLIKSGLFDYIKMIVNCFFSIFMK